MAVGKRMRERREALGLSRAVLAEQSGVSESAIKQYEKETRRPQAEQLSKIASALGVSLSYFYSDVSEQMEREVAAFDAVLALLRDQYTCAEKVEDGIEDECGGLETVEWNIGKGLEQFTLDDTEVQQLTDNIKPILANLCKLNTTGQNVAVERVEELTKIPDYQK